MAEHSLTDILQIGEGLYLDRFKTELEKKFRGHYAAIDVDQEGYVVNENKLAALTKQRKNSEK